MAVHSTQRAGAKIVYEVRGSGPALVLLHPFPTNRHFFDPLMPALESRYRLILPDLRGHGESTTGDGASMANHAADLQQICRDCEVERSAFVGVSIGGYLLFEFWRRFKSHVALLVLSNTRAQADSDEGRANRLKAAEDVEKNGIAAFLDAAILKLMGESTRRNRPDIVTRARSMMDTMNREGLAAVQRGMAARPDSVSTLNTIDVPALIICGEEDAFVPAEDAALMNKKIAGSQMVAIPQTGHYTPLERAEEFLQVLRPFLDRHRW
ncbi:MAG: alpha/beta fold hydrolase [Terriglobales bacterium]